MSVVKFPGREDEVWVCGCGCMSFWLRADGEPVCTNCELPGPKDGGGWYSRITTAGQWSGDGPVMTISAEGDLVQRRVAKRAQEADVALIVVATSPGALHMFSPNGDEDRAWAARMLDKAKTLL